MLGTRRSNLSRPKRTPLQQHLKMKKKEDDDASFDGGSAIPLFYVPNSKHICYFNGNDKGVVFENLKNNSDVTSATSLTTLFSDESSSEYDGDESISLQLVPKTATSTSLAQIATKKIKENRYSYRMNEYDDQSKTSKSTVTTKSSSTTTSSSSSSSSLASSTYPKLPSTVLKYMFKCDGGKVGEKIVLNDDDNNGVMITKRDSTIAVQEPSDAGSISSRTTISNLSSRSRRSNKFQSKRNQVLDANLKDNATATTVSVTTVVPSSKNKQMTIREQKKEPITIVAAMGRSGGYMIPIDEMNDMCPFDEESGVELQLVEDHDYYLSKIANEITEHQRRVKMELRNNSRRTHHRGESSSRSSSGSGICSGSRPVEITRTPSEADF